MWWWQLRPPPPTSQGSLLSSSVHGSSWLVRPLLYREWTQLTGMEAGKSNHQSEKIVVGRLGVEAQYKEGSSR